MNEQISNETQKKYFKFLISINTIIGGQVIVHNLAPFVDTYENFIEKTETYRDYSDLSFFEATCVDEWGKSYDILLNSNFLVNSYFTFKCLGEVNIEALSDM